MSDQSTTPLPSQTLDQASSAFRTLLVAIGGWLAGKGWIDGNIAAAAVPVILIVWPAIWGQLKVMSSHRVMKDAVAATAPVTNQEVKDD